jgi:hypothetical protein
VSPAKFNTEIGRVFRLTELSANTRDTAADEPQLVALGRLRLNPRRVSNGVTAFIVPSREAEPNSGRTPSCCVSAAPNLAAGARRACQGWPRGRREVRVMTGRLCRTHAGLWRQQCFGMLFAKITG